MIKEPLSPADAGREALRRWNSGLVHWTGHFRRAAAAEGMTPAQAARLIVSGFVHQAAEFEGGSWRYRIKNGQHIVVVAFGQGDELRLVTFI